MKKYKKNIKKGTTLVEMLVAIALLLLGTQATVMVFSKIMQSKAYSMEMGRASFTVSRSIADLTKIIRKARQSDSGAHPMVSADDNDFIFYSDYDNDDQTERIHVYFLNGAIYMQTENPSSTFPITYSQGYDETITIAENIVNTPGDPIFSYYGEDYPSNLNPLSTPANVSEISLIKIFLKINIDPNNAPDNIQQETFVEIRNLSR